MPRVTFAAAFTLWIPAVALAGHQPITIGDKAPDIDVSHWLKGKSVGEFEGGRIYVLEFWATWCAPCRISMPHFSELQKQYEDYDVTFLGISDEKPQTVVAFLAKTDSSTDQLWNDKIRYTLATDPDRSVYKTYMRGAAQDTIPTAFIIGKDQRIEWVGNPTADGLDEALAAVVRGRWDRDAFGVEYEKKVAPVREAMLVMDRMDAAGESQSWSEAQEAVARLVESQPDYQRLKASLFRKMLHECSDSAKTYAYGREILKAFWDDPRLLNQVAWVTVDDEEVQARDLAFALKAAQRANMLTEESDPAILDTLARVYFEKGDFKKAIEWQSLAARKAAGTPYSDSIAETLQKYKQVAGSRM